MKFSTLELAFDATVAVIALARPERMNAFNAQMFSDLFAALDRVDEREDVRCLIITGKDRAFCAGQDLHEDVERDGYGLPDLGTVIEERYNPLIKRLTSLRIPTIAAVNGAAVGAGASLALACDVIIANAGAYFQFSFASVGLMPDAGATWFLPQLVGLKRALALVMTGEKITAEQACSMGIVYKVCDSQTFGRDLATIARQISSGPTAAFYKSRTAMMFAGMNTLERQLLLEREGQTMLGHTADFVEGIESFREKRKPLFVGK
jgi:2-(1,2-epoxy-1,2-dihydrophenyl)acetyl-CoA isomerase